MGRLQDKVALVTGGASGIGLAAARLFAAEGAAVLIVDRQATQGETHAEEMRRKGLQVRFVYGLVGDAAYAKAMTDAAVTEFGGLDILFNNAGIEGETAFTADCSEESWDRVIEVNLKGVFLGMKYAIPAMLARGGGSIINNASVAGLVGFAGSAAYCASKGGVVQLTRAAALEYAAQNIRVNCICPGVIQTPMIDRVVQGNAQMMETLRQMEPVGRLGTAEEIAEVALFLASQEASFVTGAIIPVDGGLVAR